VQAGVLCECLGVTLVGMLASGFTVDFVQQTFKGFWLMMACGVVLRRAAQQVQTVRSASTPCGPGGSA
jgi:hypothetical protein